MGGDDSHDAGLDALIAAPEHHRLLFENDRVRVLETRIPPGETTGLHTHRWSAVLYILSRSHGVRRDAEGAVLLDTRVSGLGGAAGEATWTAPLPPHTMTNVGSEPIHVVAVELKDSPAL